MLLIRGLWEDVQLEVVAEQLMSCQRGLGSRTAVVDVRNKVISLIGPAMDLHYMWFET